MITEYERAFIGAINEHNNYGLDEQEFKWLVMLHRNGNDKTRELIEERLTDINFHSICSALHKGNYISALTLF